MNKHLLSVIAVILFVTISNPVSASCPTLDGNGNILLSSQAAVDAFIAQYSDCTSMPGNLIIGSLDVNQTPTDISNISGLSFITAIAGDLHIRFNPLLLSLHGFENLQSIGASSQINILANSALVNLKGLEHLNPQIHALFVQYNASLQSLEGLESIKTTTFNGGIFIAGNAALNNLRGLENLTNVNYLEIKEHAALQSLVGLGNCIITSALIRMNPNLMTCAVQGVCRSLSNVIVQDNATGCNTIAEINAICNCPIPPPPPSVIVTQPTCRVPMGSMAIQNPVSGAMYSFNDGQIFGTNTSIANLPPNTTYRVKVKETTGCISEAFVVAIKAAPTGTPIAINASASTICKGNYVKLSVSIYSFSYSYQWSNGQSSPTIWVNPATTTSYSVTVTTNGCPSRAAKTITVISFPFDPILNIDQPTCTVAGSIRIANLPTGASSRLNKQDCIAGKTIYKNLNAGEYKVCIALQNCEACKTVWLSSPSFAVDPTKCYKIVNRQSGKLLDVKSASVGNNAAIIQSQANGSNNQKWKFSAVGGGYYKIIAQHSQKVIACQEDDNKTDVYQCSYLSGGAKDWQLNCSGDGYFRIQKRNTNRYLTVEGFSNANNANIEIRNYQNTKYQEWAIVEVPCGSNAQSYAQSAIFTAAAIAEPEQIRLEWVSNMGAQTDFYVVEKRNNQTAQFEKLATVNNTFYDTKAHQFSYWDTETNQGVYAYRIKAASNNGSDKYSEILTVEFGQTLFAKVFPNPTDNAFTVLLNEPTTYGTTIRIYDAFGLQKQEAAIKEGAKQVAIELVDLPNGIYLLRVSQRGKLRFTKRIVLQR